MATRQIMAVSVGALMLVAAGALIAGNNLAATGHRSWAVLGAVVGLALLAAAGVTAVVLAGA